MHVHSRTFTITLSSSLITPISPTILGELVADRNHRRDILHADPILSLFLSVSSGQTSSRENRLRTGIYIIVALGVSTTTSPDTVSPAILNRALIHIELRRTLRGFCSELNLVVDHHQRRWWFSVPNEHWAAAVGSDHHQRVMSRKAESR